MCRLIKCLIFILLFIALIKPALAKDINKNEQKTAYLVNNVTLLDPEGDKKSTVANILINNGLLDLISQDDLSSEKVITIIDAKKGFLLGTLEPGKAPNFLILKENPNNDFNILLDTKKYTVLAIHDGIIVKNLLTPEPNKSKLSTKKKEGAVKRASWLAYTPPTFILPSSYKDKQWNFYKNKYFSSLFTGVVAFDSQKWLEQDTQSMNQVSDLTVFNGGEIRAFRAGVAGRLYFDKPWVYSISAATATFDKGYNSNSTDSLNFLDWRLDIPFLSDNTLSIGKQKEPISMERLMTLVHIPMQERSLVADTLLPSRNIGVVISGQSQSKKVTWAGGIFNDWLDSKSTNGFGENSTQVVGRVTWLPYLSSDEYELFHLGVGLRYSNDQEDLQFSSEPEFNKSPLYIDSGIFHANDSFTYNLEASWRKGPLWLLGEYTENNIDSSEQESPKLSGYFLSAALSLTGEMRDYNKNNGTFAPLAVSQSVNQGGIGAWEITSRWSVFDGNNKQVMAGDSQIFSLGIFWWLTPKFNLSANYRWVTLERCSLQIATCEISDEILNGESHGLNLRLMLML